MKENHQKTEFQVERLAFFSDAVFAIAITLLIIEIKVPEIEHVSEASFGIALWNLMPKFMGFIFSFFIIGRYWLVHHSMFGLIENYDTKLMALNLIFLFSIVLMPLSTAIFSEYSSARYIKLIFPYAFYVGNVCLTGILPYFLWDYVGNTSKGIVRKFPHQHYLRNAKIRALIIPFVFLLSLAVAALVHPGIGRFVLFLIPLFMRLVTRSQKAAGPSPA